MLKKLCKEAPKANQDRSSQVARANALLAVAWVAAGSTSVILGNALDLSSMAPPGFLLILLGIGMALHVEQASKLSRAEPDQETRS